MSIFSDLEKHIVSPDVLRKDGTPSVSMAMLDDSGELSAHVISNGNEDIATIYQACSISKAITALAVAKLVDLNKLSYEDKIVDHISKHRLNELGKTESDVEVLTIGALVSHRSGLSQHGFPGYSEQQETPCVEEIFNGRPPSQTPRIHFSSMPFAQFSYSGGGFLLLQVCLESVLNKPFAQVMHDLVLAPLKMSRSSYATVLHSGEHNYARAYSTGDQEASSSSRGYRFFPEAAAAGLWTTPTDLLKAVAAIQYSLSHHDGFLSQTTARRMLTKVSPNHPKYSMGMGWASDECFFGHREDNAPGFNTYVFGTHRGLVNRTDGEQASKEIDISGAFAIMTNSVLGFSTIQKIIAAVFWLKLWPPIASLPSRFGSLTDFVPYTAPRGTYLNNSWKSWVGEWHGGWTIIEQDNRPTISFRDIIKPVKLRPAAAPVSQKQNEEEHVLVAEGYELAIRLTIRNGERLIYVIQSEGVQSCKFERSLSAPTV